MVYGNLENGYTQDSPICIAALHTGALNNKKKGYLHLVVIANKKNYDCGLSCPQQNGIFAKSKSDYTGGYKILNQNVNCK